MKSIKFVFFKAIFIFFLMTGSSTVFSQTSTESSIKSESGNKVQFVGVDGDYLVFDLHFSELPVKGCTLVIMDESDNFYFDESITGNSFSRRFKIKREGIAKISFKATGRGFLFSQSFTIKKEERFVVITD